MANKPKIDLRALEANALKVVNRAKYKTLAKKTATTAQAKLAKIKTQYAKDLASLIGKWQRKEITYAKFLKSTQSIMLKSYEKAYTLGFKAQGLGKLTASDRVWLKFEVRDELFYWKRFMSVLKKFFFKSENGEDVPFDIPTLVGYDFKSIKYKYYRRFNMYIDALDAVYTQGRVSGLPPSSTLINWVYGAAEHCPECVYLEKMSPYVKETLPTVPRAGKTRCLSHCKCVLVFQPINERQYTLVKDYSSRKSTHIKRLIKTRSLKPSQAARYIKIKYKA